MSSDEDFEEMVKDLQHKIDRNEEKTYSKVVIKEYRNPTNFGFIKNSDAIGQIKGPCGDTVRIYLKIEGNMIQDCSFWTDGCGASIACGNMLTKIIKGKTIENALKIKSDELINVLGGLPKENLHCSDLAVNTLHKALKNHHQD